MNSRFTQQPAVASAGATERKSGRAAFTEDGRSIWEWQTATGVFTRTVTNEQLARLEATELRLEEAPASESRISISYAAHSRARRSPVRSPVRSISYNAAPKSSSFGALHGLLRRLMGE